MITNAHTATTVVVHQQISKDNRDNND